jgi:hypothetical protein
MTKATIKAAGAIIAILTIATLGMGSAWAESDPSSNIQAELEIMSKVFEESLNQSSLGDWKDITVGASPFCPTIRHQYIPTVGAIFNLGVNFSVVEPATPEVEAPEEPVDEKDLWAKFAKEGSGPRGLGAQNRIDILRKEIIKAKDKPKDLSKLVQELQALENRKAAGDAAVAENVTIAVSSKGSKKGGDLLKAFALGKGSRYDAAKVEAMRHALIEAMAGYGSRMENLPDAERILIVVEAPKSLAVEIGWEAKNFAGNVKLPETVVTRGRRASGGGGGAIGGGGGFGYGGGMGGGGFGMGGFASTAEKDRYLLAIRKSDLSAETTYESLEGKVEEIRY